MDNNKIGFKNIIKKAVIILLWLLLWQIVCWIVGNPIFFAGPIEVIKEMAVMSGSREFAVSTLYSVLRITGGFFIAFFLACLLAVFAYCFTLLEELLKPFVAFIKSVPVASVVVVLLIWFGSKNLSLYVTFMVVFPNVYINALTGLKNTDRQLLEMAEVFRFSFRKRLLYIYIPAVMPYLISGAGVSVGMSFKSGVAAEVIGLPLHSIGEQLYNEKIYLNTAGVFAWTVVIICLSSLIEWLVVMLLEHVGNKKRLPVRRSDKRKVEQDEIRAGIRGTGTGILLKDVNVRFEDKKVLDQINLELKSGNIYCVMGASGCGKTTLLRVCAGLQELSGGNVLQNIVTSENELQKNTHKEHTAAESGAAEKNIQDRLRIGMVFQEDRLCVNCPALSNILLTADDRYTTEEILGLLQEILPPEAFYKQTEQLSGGMKRRLAVARAVLSDADCLLLDEPFTGLDEANHERVLQWILRNRNGRLLVITTHDETDAVKMDASVIKF